MQRHLESLYWQRSSYAPKARVSRYITTKTQLGPSSSYWFRNIELQKIMYDNSFRYPNTVVIYYDILGTYLTMVRLYHDDQCQALTIGQENHSPYKITWHWDGRIRSINMDANTECSHGCIIKSAKAQLEQVLRQYAHFRAHCTSKFCDNHYIASSDYMIDILKWYAGSGYQKCPYGRHGI